MKRSIISLLLFSAALSAQMISDSGTVLKRGFYSSVNEFIRNAPSVPAPDHNSLVIINDGSDGESGTVDYYAAKLEEGEAKKIRGESFVGCSDGDSVYFVDNQSLIKGKTLRRVTVGPVFSYYRGTDVANTGKPVMTGGGSAYGGVLPRYTSSIIIPVLFVVSMKTGEVTSLTNGLFLKSQVKSLLEPYANEYKFYCENPSRDLNVIAGIFDQVNKSAKK